MRRAGRFAFAVATGAALGCSADADSSSPAATTDTSGWSESERTLHTLDQRGSQVLLGLRAPLRPESDAPPRYEVWLREERSNGVLPIAEGARSAVLGHGAVWVVDTLGQLQRVRDGQATRIVGPVLGRPSLCTSGEVVASIAGEAPGESDLALVDESGGIRALAPAPGPDDLPTALPDGRVVFVSGRTGVASLFIVDPLDGTLVQLTNHGLVAGRGLIGFVPVPAHAIEVEASLIRYDDGHGRRFSIELASGRIQRTDQGAWP